MNYEEGKSVDIVWTPTIRRAYLVTVLIKLMMEIIYIYQLYLLQMRQTNETGFGTRALWTIPEEYQCTVGEEAHSACAQVFQ
jgi:hypothetical protein